MDVSYKRLWKKLIDIDMKKSQLREQAQLSGSTMVKLGKNEFVSLDVLARICCVLQCQLSDVAEIIPDEAGNVPDGSAKE